MKTLDINQAAEFLGAHKETIRRMVAYGLIPGVKIGRAWMFIESDLLSYMRSQYREKDEFINFEMSKKIGSKNQCRLKNKKTTGGLTSHTKEQEYEEVLALK